MYSDQVVLLLKDLQRYRFVVDGFMFFNSWKFWVVCCNDQQPESTESCFIGSAACTFRGTNNRYLQN